MYVCMYVCMYVTFRATLIRAFFIHKSSELLGQYLQFQHQEKLLLPWKYEIL